MKNITFFSIILFSFCLQAQAPRGFSISAGLNQTMLDSDDLLADPGVGFKGGLVFNWGYHETYNYQIEVMYNHGSINLLTVDENFESSGTSKTTFNTIDVGFYFNYYIIKPDEGKFYLGPQIGATFAVAPQFTPSGGGDEYYQPYLIQENELTNIPKVIYGAGLGLTGGYNNFRFDLRYTLGLNNVLADVQTNDYDEFNRYTGPKFEGKINMVSFTVSYRLAKLLGGE
ncbi:MAG TPA: outer membrane beta-barrel protein [Flavobacterium sp.]|jgi:hypothetical protein